MKKGFIITIDTECDNQWDEDIKHGTKNAYYIPRFQEICEKYGMKPVYLVDYEMAQDVFLANFLKEKSDSGLCEIGMHLHSWNTPPFDRIDKSGTKSYLIEHEEAIMESKIKNITELLGQTFGKEPVSHRAGRWAIDSTYIRLLAKYGYKIDCTFTPGVNWYKEKGYQQGGTNYVAKMPELMKEINNNAMIELPATVKKYRSFRVTKSLVSMIKEIARFILGRNIWIRPSLCDKRDIVKLLYDCKDEKYLEFMMHSSEFMPGGSPYFKDEESINELYKTLESIFEAAIKTGRSGMTLEEVWMEEKEEI